MKRREAIRNIAMASVATMFLTGCHDKNVAEFFIDGQLNLNQKHKDYLAAISESILPVQGVSNKISNPVDYILTMLNDCTKPEDLTQFVSGFESYKQLMGIMKLKIKSAEPQDMLKAVTDLMAADTLNEELVEAQISQEDIIHFVDITKSLSVRNLKNSEYYKVEIEDYKMIPDSYEACITI